MEFSRKIFKAFKAKGLTVSAEASEALISVLSKEDNVDGSLSLILDEIKERIDKQEIKSNIIDVGTITAIVAELSSSEEDLAHESLQLMDAFNSPKLVFDERNKSFKIVAKPPCKMLGDVESRANMFRERLLLTQQRLLRSGLFILKGMGQKKGTKADELSTIESLLGSSGTKILFGMLTQPEEGKWFLEDLGSTIQLDLSRAKLVNYVFFTEGSQIVVQGELYNGIFRVEIMGMPPAEEREVTLKNLGIHDAFGIGSRPQQIQQMKEMEVSSEHMMFVIISDIQLDKPLVLEKLQLVFEGFENNQIYPLFILMGSFITKPISRAIGGRELIKTVFNALADIICKFPGIQEYGKFVLVPGPIDAGSNVAIPRKPIPYQLTETLTSRVKNVTFASNPCRIRYYTQEIVLFREDLLKKMQQYLVLPLTLEDNSSSNNSSGSNKSSKSSKANNKNKQNKESENIGDENSPHNKLDKNDHSDANTVPDITEQLVKTIIDQEHLCPLPLHAKPIHWELDHALRLFPLPHLLVLADHADHYTYSFHSCHTVNPGSFSSDFSFVVYHPATKNVQFSRVK